MYGKRLTPQDYAALASKHTIPEIVAYLQMNTHYASVLSGVDADSVHRGLLEVLLRRANFERYIQLLNFQQLKNRPFFNFLIVEAEVRELLTAIQFYNAGASVDYIKSLPSYLMPYTRFSLIELAKARSFKAICDVVRHLPYYEVLQQVQRREDGQIRFLHCEVLLRTYLFQWMLDTVQDRYHGDAKTALQEQILVQIDLINLINAYRVKRYFSATTEELDLMMLPFYGKIGKKQMKQLYAAPDLAAFVKLLMKSYYGRFLDGLRAETEAVEFEKRLGELRCRLARRSLVYSENSAVSLFSMTYLFEVEQKNLTTLIECVRYGKSPPYIDHLLVKF